MRGSCGSPRKILPYPYSQRSQRAAAVASPPFVTPSYPSSYLSYNSSPYAPSSAPGYGSYQQPISRPANTINYSSNNNFVRANPAAAPVQRTFLFPSYILSSEAADTHLSYLGVQGILMWMNTILGTRKRYTRKMHELLHFCCLNFQDFGQAYACLQPRWHMTPSEALSNIKARRKDDEELRSKSLEDRIVSDTECLPSRLWDLWSNRVVPLWVAQVDCINESGKWFAVYHSRVNKSRQQRITSPINGREWPIPIPIGTSLEQIRVDLLRVGMQCNTKLAWIDILCQRQEPEGTSSEEVFSEADVPTVWPVYTLAEWIIFYLNGLSSPFEVSSSVYFRGRHSGDHAYNSSYDDELKTDINRAQRRTIYSSINEAERERLEVDHQKSFTGPSYILSSELADTLLSDLGRRGILSRMNDVLRTDRVLSPEMRLLLLFCLCTFTDFGQAYSLLRPRWHMDPSEALTNIQIRRKEDQKLRSEALENDIVVKPRIPPRRLWDIWSNRVMPFWVVEVGKIRKSDIRETIFHTLELQRRNWLAVSHSWMHENHRHNVNSPVNNREWPIPIPIETTLERIRIELLNLGAEHNIHFVWLDVLCLRQEGVVTKEGLRKAEWKLDVPTIGPIYAHAERTVYYFSGLGRSFTAPTDKNDTRHWMNRAWTLQETQQRLTIAGRSHTSSPYIPYSADLWYPDDHIKWQKSIDNSSDVMKALMTPFIENDGLSVQAALKLMRHRTGTSELDKIAGLVYCLNRFEPPLPAYIVGEDVEDAWHRLIKATDSKYRAQLFFGFPNPGNSRHAWYPSWHQIKDSPTIPTSETFGKVKFDESSNEYSVTCYCLEDCLVDGLSDVQIGGRDGSSTPRREGKVHVVDRKGVKHDFSITADHETPIADCFYTLVGYWDSWVVARNTIQGLIEKISVILVEKFDDCMAIAKVGRSFGKSSLRLA